MRGYLRFRPRCFVLPAPPSSAQCLALLAQCREPVWLDSAGGAPARFSLLAFDPLVAASLAPPQEPLGLRALLERVERRNGDDLPEHFHGGFLGAFAYDIGVSGERQKLPPDPCGLPSVVGGIYVDYLLHDHVQGKATLVLAEEPGDGRANLRERRERILAVLGDPLALAPAQPLGPLVRHTPAAEHSARIETLRAQIAQGELYQANLAHRYTRAMRGHPLAIYAKLREHHPAPYQCYLSWGADPLAPEAALLSASPELLLECSAQGALRTRPIKGTIARESEESRDQAARARLLSSTKDLAELAMIVDLERNDLGRVARPGSVRVVGYPSLESYATVHHLVADVLGELRPGKSAADALAAVFPGGSITGAPKLAAMSAIAALEPEGRGFFTGSAGLLDFSGRALWSILIRTLVWRRTGAPDQGLVSLHVGGGITWDSQAEAELAETYHKGAALARALEGTQPAPLG